METVSKDRDRIATVEHVYPRSDIKRFLGSPVIAVHYKCNQEKDRQDWERIYRGYDKEEKYAGLLINYVKFAKN